MFKKLIFLVCIAVAAVSCLKSKDERTCAYPTVIKSAPAEEQDSLQAWLDSSGIDYVKHPTGFFYNITNPGTGTDTMTLCSEILINYKGQFQNGMIFDQGTNVYLVLGALIDGWKKGIPLLKKGGQMKLYIPPSLGYGSKDYVQDGVVVIPAQSNLVFDVTLLDYLPGY